MSTKPDTDSGAFRRKLRWLLLAVICLLPILWMAKNQVQQWQRRNYPTVATEIITGMRSMAHFPGESTMLLELDFGVILATHGVVFDPMSTPYESLQIKQGPECLYACIQGRCALMLHAVPKDYNLFTKKAVMDDAATKHLWLNTLGEWRKSCQL